MQGRVAVSHAFALGAIAPSLFEKTADALARAEVAIMTSCPPSAPVPPVRALRERGVTVFAGSDNIRDCWSPFGNGDMLDRAAIIAERHAMFTDRELEDVFALATTEADKALGRPSRELRAGVVADLVAVEAASVAECGRRSAAAKACHPRGAHRRRARRSVRGAGLGSRPWRAAGRRDGDRSATEGGRTDAPGAARGARGELTQARATALRCATIARESRLERGSRKSGDRLFDRVPGSGVGAVGEEPPAATAESQAGGRRGVFRKMSRSGWSAIPSIGQARLGQNSIRCFLHRADLSKHPSVRVPAAWRSAWLRTHFEA